MDENDLDSILNDEPIEQPAIEAQPPEQSERPRDENGRFVSASDPGDENPEPAQQPAQAAAPPAAQQDAEQGNIPVAALRDERQKRQQLEAQLQQYQQYFASLEQQQPAQPAEVPDMYVDPQGYTQWVAAQIRENIMQEVQQYGSQFETSNLARVSEMLARQRHADYDEKIAVVVEAAKSNPHIAYEVANAADPAEHAYKVASNILAARQLGTTEIPSRDAIEAEIREKIMAELGLSSKPTAPSSLASDRSLAVSRSGPAWGGPETLEDILR